MARHDSSKDAATANDTAPPMFGTQITEAFPGTEFAPQLSIVAESEESDGEAQVGLARQVTSSSHAWGTMQPIPPLARARSLDDPGRFQHSARTTELDITHRCVSSVPCMMALLPTSKHEQPEMMMLLPTSKHEH